LVRGGLRPSGQQRDESRRRGDQDQVQPQCHLGGVGVVTAAGARSENREEDRTEGGDAGGSGELLGGGQHPGRGTGLGGAHTGQHHTDQRGQRETVAQADKAQRDHQPRGVDAGARGVQGGGESQHTDAADRAASDEDPHPGPGDQPTPANRGDHGEHGHRPEGQARAQRAQA
jgi:hypothetical protein